MTVRPDIAAALASTRKTPKSKRPEVDIAERHPEYPANRGQEIDGEVMSPEGAGPSLDGNEDLQKPVLAAIKKHSSSGSTDARGAVEAARDRRNYFRGMQQFFWNEDRQDIQFIDDDDSNDRTFNITQAYGKIFISTFMGATPKVEPEPDNAFEADSIQDTSKARDYEAVWRKKNDIAAIQMEIGRLLFLDGRIITQTEQTEDGEFTRIFGVLESRVAGSANGIDDWTLLQTENDFPLVKMKRKYPDQRKKLSSSSGDAYFRNARQAVRRRASSDTSIDIDTGEDGTGLCTITRSYLTPDFYEHLNDDERTEMEETFPDGCCIVHSGDTYLESMPYKPLEVLDVIHAIPCDGMNGPAIVDPLMPVQDSVTTGFNLMEETFDHGIPVIYYDESTNIDTLNQDKNKPGASRKMTRKAGDPAAAHFYTTPELNPSAALIEYVQEMQGPFAQFVTGLPPAIQGFGDQDQKTASGYAQMKAQALGQMAIVWKPYTSWYTREMTRCVKLAATAQNPIRATLDSRFKGRSSRSVSIMPSELKGFKFTNVSDENFPETYTERRNALMQVLQDPETKKMLMAVPDNVRTMKNLIGLNDLVWPGDDSSTKQLEEIAEMERQSPQPDPSQMPQQALPPVGAPPLQPQLTSSVPVSKYDDDEVEEAECLRWINSAEGQEAKRTKPQWYQDVCLHCDLHTAQKQQKAAASAPPPVPPPPPSVAINFADLPPQGQVQAAAQHNINIPLPTPPMPTGPPA